MKQQPKSSFADAVRALKEGELVAFPTETVYGLGADAQNEKALKRLFALKGRPISHPVIVHLSCFEQLDSWCKLVPEEAKLLAKEFWPGPLTLILSRSKKALNLVTGGQDSVGIRIPGHPIAQELLRLFGDGVAAPSANKFGRISPTSADHVVSDLGNSVKVILDGGNCQIGIESTIVDLSGSSPKILRPGMIGVERIAQVLGLKNTAELDSAENVPRVPGSMPSHYAPRTPLKIVSTEEIDRLASSSNIDAINEPISVLSFQRAPSLLGDRVSQWVKAKADPIDYARDLYKNLRILDASGSRLLLVEAPPDTLNWCAIKDRLMRAANQG